MVKDPIEKMRDFNEGLTGGPRSKMPGADLDPDIALGKRLRSSGPDLPAEKQTFGEAVMTLLALALTAVGLFVGGTRWGLWGALGLGAAGFIAAIVIPMLIGESFKGRAEKRLWNKRGHDHTSQKLRDYWRATFDSDIDDRLVDDLAEGGAGWIVTPNGTFVLKLRDGRSLRVGHDGTTGRISVNQQGRGFSTEDAYRMMLARRSAGATSLGAPTGSKKAVARMWAAAKHVGLDVSDVKPDALALQALDEIRSLYPNAGGS